MNISEHWKTIFDTLQDALLVVDAGGNIVAANPAAERTTGYAPDELIGQSCRILNCNGCKIIGKGSCEQWCGLFSQGESRAKRCTITNKNRRMVSIIKNASVLRDRNGDMIGAVESLTDISEMVRQQREIMALRKACRVDEPDHGILGRSKAVRRMIALIESVALTDAPVMIQGASGTGKELVALAIHESGDRRDKGFIRVNCAALNESLLESELFGHVKGAFTGAERARIGRFEDADGGTILLDEIGDIPPSIQVKLLRVLEQKEVERVGDHRPIPVDARLITATNRNLEQMVAHGQFREDLFFRVNVFPIHCPELKERLDDIPLLVRHFIDAKAEKTGKRPHLSPEAMGTLQSYHWPGNIRELRNAVEYALVLCPGDRIDPAHLPPRVRRASERGPGPSGFAMESGQKAEGKTTGAGGVPAGGTTEREELLAALRAAGGNQTEAGRRLGVSRVTVWKRIKKHGVNLDRDLRAAAEAPAPRQRSVPR